MELTIIKLSYLQQALELVNNDGVVSKKKLIDGAKTVAFRALPIIRAAGSQPEAVTAKPVSEAKLIIEEPEQGYKSIPTRR